MSFNIKLSLDLHCDDRDENDMELDLLCDYISDRLMVVDPEIVMQSLAEAIIDMSDQLEENAIRLH